MLHVLRIEWCDFFLIIHQSQVLLVLWFIVLIQFSVRQLMKVLLRVWNCLMCDDGVAQYKDNIWMQSGSYDAIILFKYEILRYSNMYHLIFYLFVEVLVLFLISTSPVINSISGNKLLNNTEKRRLYHFERK